LQETEVILLALDGALGTRARVLMGLPEVSISGDERVEAIVLRRIGVDDAAIRGIRATIGEEGARGKGRGLAGSRQGAAPLDAQAIRAEASAYHGAISGTDGDMSFDPQGASISGAVLVALIERDDEGHTPASSRQAEVADGIVGRVQGGDADGETKGLASMVEGGQGVDGIVAVAVGDRDQQGELTAMLEGVGDEFVETVAIDPTLAVVIPAPERGGVPVGTQTSATVLWFLGPIVASTELLAVGVSPRREFAAVTGHIEVGKVNQAEFRRTRDEAGKEDGLENAFISGEGGEVAIAFEDGGEGW
jgi:hypothetical protein